MTHTRFHAWWQLTVPIVGYHAAALRVLLGAYVMLTMLRLWPDAPALLGAVPPAADWSAWLPAPLGAGASPGQVHLFLVVMLVLALCFMLGVLRRVSALLLWYGWACLFQRGAAWPYTWLPYLGLLLLLWVLLPAGEPLRLGRRTALAPWRYPAVLYGLAWTLFALACTLSGLLAARDPDWAAGRALGQWLHDPLAVRPGLAHTLALLLPAGLWRVCTWGWLAVQVACLPLALHPRTRGLAWLLLLPGALALAALSTAPDAGLGLLLVLLWLWDPRWLSGAAPGPRHVVLYDGVCGLCNGLVRVLVQVDAAPCLWYAPLQGAAGARLRARAAPTAGPDTMVYVRDADGPHERGYQRAAAVVAILHDLGGPWRVLATLALLLPLALRNRLYDALAVRRYRLFGRSDACQLPPAGFSARFLP